MMPSGARTVSSTPDRLFHTQRGSGQPLLLVHGLMVTGEMFDPVIGEFAAQHRVVVPDLRGHGRSRHLPPPDTARQLSDDLSHLLDELGLQAAAVLGYSQGGAVAQQFALDHPERCSRLILACSYACNMSTPREWLEGHTVPLLLRILGTARFARMVVAQGARELGQERIAWLARLMADQDRGRMVAAWTEAMAFDSRARLSDIGCPTLIVAGSDDRAVPMRHARMLHDGIAGSDLAVIPDAGHTLIWTHTDAFIESVQEFLQPIR
jgi:pimeloyl-ACP methyl ester carboxylesterase